MQLPVGKCSWQLFKAAGGSFFKAAVAADACVVAAAACGVAQRWSWSWRESVAFLGSSAEQALASCVAKNDATDW